jgi:hypothetical protein
VHHAKQLWPNAVILLADRRRCRVPAR